MKVSRRGVIAGYVRKQLGDLLARHHNATQRLQAEQQRHGDLAEQIRLALGEGREDLAETATSMLLDLEAQFPVLESCVSDCLAEGRDLENYLCALQARKREMEAEMAQALKTARFAESAALGARVPGTAGIEAAVEKATNDFDRVATGMTGVSSAVRSPDAVKLAELEELARKNRIAERLARFKQEADD